MNTIAVVVTYNRKDLLRQCIEHIQAQEGAGCDIFVIDNASTDGTQEMLRTDFLIEDVAVGWKRPADNARCIFYHNTGSNLGGAGGFERGVKLAVEAGYEYLWLMDDDTLPKNTALAELFRADRHLNGNWGFLSSVAYWTDGTICRMNIQKKDIFRHVRAQDYRHTITPIKMCSFVSLLIKADIVKEIGLPIGEYFIWTDDYEFTGRISQTYPCYMVPRSKVIHAMQKQLRVDFAKDDASRIDRYRYIYRNDVHCYRQYGIAGWLYLILKDLYTALNILLHSNGQKIFRLQTIVTGFKVGLQFRPAVNFPEIREGGAEREFCLTLQHDSRRIVVFKPTLAAAFVEMRHAA